MFIYYVYAYLRHDGTPYYIGKGKNNRAFDKHDNIQIPSDITRIVFLETSLSEIGALALERRYIKWYGRKTEGGILRNILDGGDMTPTAKKGRKITRTKDHNEKIRESLKQFCANTNRGQIKNAGTKGRIWINNGVTCKCVFPNNIPQGWHRGRI